MGTAPSSSASPGGDLPAPGRIGGGGSGPHGRVVGLDVARAVAIIGMIAVNVGPRGAEGFLGALYDLPLGRASLLFMLLAGVGISLMTRSVRGTGGTPVPWRMVLWRAVLLLLGGLALQIPDHEASVILPLYGLLFIACLPLLRAPTWVLGALTGTFVLVGPLAWVAARTTWAPVSRRTEPTLLDPPGEILSGILFTGAYPAVVWAAPFLAGMLLGRLDLRSAVLQRRLVLWGAVCAAGGHLLSQVLILVFGTPERTVGWDRLVSATAHSHMPLWLIASSGAALFVLGLCLLAGRLASGSLPVLAATGRLSLTIYVGHLLALAAFVRPGPGSLATGIFTTVVLCIGSILFAWLWTRRFSAGPLEMLLRGPRQPRRAS
ncbi:DUF418 domain-containing protein [uncultured Citricoccus sp.]|uniref:DUF418 domain-containing protein n=1 Tax=uncultured Citricoccus sp. TaxID=614031 RepID=UPI00260DB550|nr:DUF418 domain-containing protein [uncultured Citricoccus sp.]HRO94001.1 DUF418 domain-containing protein [Citricoccus sp.]